jgi:glyoxalase family protein
MVHRIVWRVACSDAVGFWAERLAGAGYDSAPAGKLALRFHDFEGLEHELLVADSADAPLIAYHPQIPPELALQGLYAVRAYTQEPGRSRAPLDTLSFAPSPTSADGYEVRGERRSGGYLYDSPSPARARQGAGTVHHVAWACRPEDQEAWQRLLSSVGAHPTPVINRHYFRSVYFREPSGVLFELATIGPGFTIDEPLETLGEKLSLPPPLEHLRAQIEPRLTPLRNPRDGSPR